MLLKLKVNYARNFMKPYMEKDCISNFPVAMAYVPWQHLTQTFENLDEAYNQGTIFPELCKPFNGRRDVKC